MIMQKKERIVLFTFLIILALICLIPFYLSIINSFKDRVQIIKNPLAFPNLWILDNYTKAWKSTDLGLAFINSLLITLMTISLIVLTSTPLSYVLAKNKEKKITK